jgi:DNA polymerase-3 subunit delta'
MASEVLPWLVPLYDRFHSLVEKGELPHSILLSGQAFSGKSILLRRFVSRLLCAEENAPCDRCHQCELLRADTHPDFKLLVPEDSKQILIDQVRRMVEWAAQTAQQGGRKVCVIQPAHFMNVQAANALLKCLEEPSEAITIILVSEEVNRLLPTIRSRCQQFTCHTPDRGQAIAWLEQNHESKLDAALLLDIAADMPLRAMEVIDDDYLELRRRIAEGLVDVLRQKGSPIEMAGLLSGEPLGLVLDIIYQIIADTISRSSTGVEWRNSDLSAQLEKLVVIDLQKRFEFLDRLSRTKDVLGGTANANPQMLFEWLLTG